ncbi:ATP-binding protein [Nocardia nova]|uniref:ATP-binding protein n=1 Tax=Nocardia nova TaxID=37330 RepID=UPI000CE9F577|nr:ATP-binding protein [Nocardia nova]PPJ34398.1 two-component sensor histidine kinase [Nocardia nova]
MIRRWPIRIRLTAAFVAMMAIVLAVIGFVTVTHMRSFLDNAVTESLEYQLAELRPAAASPEPDLPGPSQDTAIQIITSTGEVVASTQQPPGPAALSTAELRSVGDGTVIVDRPALAGLAGPVRLAAAGTSGGKVVVVAESLADRDAAVADLSRELAVGFPLVLIAAAIGAYLLATAALRPVERMRARAATITDTDTAARLPVPRAHDEISRLGTTFNDLLARLHEAVDRERRFVADAGHELRTPLGLLTTELELALRRPRSNDELTTALRSGLVEVERLSRLARAMLTATATPRDPDAPLPDIVLGPLLDTVVARHRQAAGVITIDTAPGLSVRADPDDLDRILTNILDNAFQHGAPPISIRATRTDAATVHVAIRDHGPGVAPEFLPTMFERFTRADTARTRGGSGLGLAIAATLAARNQAVLTAANHPDGGLELTLTFSSTAGTSRT